MILEQQILKTLQSVLPTSEFTPLHEPTFQGNEWNYVKDCLDSTFVSSVGKYVDLFEERLAEFTGVKRAVAVVNGTAALHIALKIVGVEKDDEVLIPSLTFVATANAVSYSSAIPHFVDSEEKTLGLDPYKLDLYLKEIGQVTSDGCINKLTGRRIKAVVPMHTFGHPVDIDPLLEVCRKYKLVLIEDAAESLGSYYKGKHTGSFGKVAALSFNGNKIITTGGGGAILTNDDNLANYAKHLTTTAKVPHQWEYIHDEVGYNYRMPNLNAALGCAQLEALPKYIKSKRELAQKYKTAFNTVQGVNFFQEPSFAKSNYWLNVVVLSRELILNRESILEVLNNNGIMSRPVWMPLHKLSMYSQCPRMDLDGVDDLEKRIINIPSSSLLGEF
ncbi:aminotransferase DegT [Anaerobacillus alkalidiazotrophicus]|uniref:Aminotransferase DegT n=1 Tax=Anaerobacillus alkalidiazotrophicus TaxID=472963 RepID=A0A1S2MD56_9BACI|nr:LegC family aminotransferase [Anaerobacillus alkalidiazotrophicus]OIJ22373.1 aminotransferase DegT [Anaerobacillus alkalidiazotrophicus]